MKPNITVIDQSKIRIAAFECVVLGKVSQKTIDMTPYAGQRVRVWLDSDGTYSLDPKKEHFWQSAEFDVPEVQPHQVDTGEVDDDDNPVMASEPLPLDLTCVEIEKWELPKS